MTRGSAMCRAAQISLDASLLPNLLMENPRLTYNVDYTLYALCNHIREMFLISESELIKLSDQEKPFFKYQPDLIMNF